MIRNEEVLWQLFDGPDHRQPGLRSRSFEFIWRILHDWDALHPTDSTSAAKKAPQVRLTDTTRFYALIGRERRACVPQSKLVVIGKAMRDPELRVQYLGTMERE